MTSLPTHAFTALGDERFVSLTTFRRTGEPVSTPVWVVRDGDTLLVTTPDDSGKVKRLRHTARVELRPCSRSGSVPDGAVPVPGDAELVTDPTEVARLSDLFQDRYGLEYRAFMLVERLAARRQKPRVIVRITAEG
ncbi:PPOX class F420-dependent oxidoreductase [Cellulomonas sp. NS3]|uniref:PPOX class F420-dependent oxidoreductase n=1 Tax=Cellulomonas sp. NS3 TaxID=2973977 RepID=UPI0021628CE3|nr:PPOX class F420-dependent oxidoreductase [Cellulomonas sp. NS3]